MSTYEDAKRDLMAASNAVCWAVAVIRMELPTIELFLKECSDMENFGSIVDPTLYRDPTRRARAALLQPTFEAAVRFLRVYDAQKAKAETALEKVTA